jgi:hypothetical protein
VTDRTAPSAIRARRSALGDPHSALGAVRH